MDAKQVHQQVTKKFGTAAYPNPARVGVAYMIAPIIRTVDDTNVPATNVTDTSCPNCPPRFTS